jgi:hypothetical protein
VGASVDRRTQSRAHGDMLNRRDACQPARFTGFAPEAVSFERAPGSPDATKAANGSPVACGT